MSDPDAIMYLQEKQQRTKENHMNATLAANLATAAANLAADNERKVEEGIAALAAKCNANKVRTK